jgi:hypothetical protein
MPAACTTTWCFDKWRLTGRAPRPCSDDPELKLYHRGHRGTQRNTEERALNRKHLRDCFHFYDHSTVHEQVDPIANLKADSIVLNGKRKLSKNVTTAFAKLVGKTP